MLPPTNINPEFIGFTVVWCLLMIVPSYLLRNSSSATPPKPPMLLPLAMAIGPMMYILGSLAFTDAVPIAAVSWMRDLAYLMFRTQFVIQFVFVAAVVAHVAEAFVALRICKQAGASGTATAFWFFQTVLLGFPSLGVLKKLRRANKSA